MFLQKAIFFLLTQKKKNLNFYRPNQVFIIDGAFSSLKHFDGNLVMLLGEEHRFFFFWWARPAHPFEINGWRNPLIGASRLGLVSRWKWTSLTYVFPPPPPKKSVCAVASVKNQTAIGHV